MLLCITPTCTGCSWKLLPCNAGVEKEISWGHALKITMMLQYLNGRDTKINFIRVNYILKILWKQNSVIYIYTTHNGSSWVRAAGAPSQPPSAMLITMTPGTAEGPVLWKRTLSWNDWRYTVYIRWHDI